MNRCDVRTFSACALLLPVLAACGDGGEAGAGAVVRDSAGITILENPSPDAVPVRSVSGPILTIGTVAGAEEQELHDITGVVRLSDGGIAIATGGTEIRWFGADGAFLRRAGGEGGGPGEFRGIRYMRALAGDSLLIFDSGNRRVTVIAPDGSFVRGETIGVGEERPQVVAGALLDGTVLTRSMGEPPPTSTPLYRVQMEFAVSRGEATLPLRTYLGPEAALHADGSGGGIGSVFISVLPFARAAHAAAGPDRFFLGSSDSYQIDVWDAAGRLIRVIRADVPVTPVTAEMRQAYIQRELERRRRQAEGRGRPFDQPAMLQLLRDQQHAPALPAFTSLLATAEGGVWVKEFTITGAELSPERWAIFDPEGRLTTAVELPPRFTPTFVEGSLVLGVWRDTLDVQYVHGYAMDPGENRPRSESFRRDL